MRIPFLSAGLLCAWALSSAGAQQVSDLDISGSLMTRASLERALDRLEKTVQSTAYSDRMRERARQEAEALRRRLESGDLQVGDRVLLEVQGEPTLTDTFRVDPGRVLTLEDIGQIKLEGVLRSELQQYLSVQLAQYVRDPVVKARSLVRISIFGGVGNPGFHTVPSEYLLSDVLTAAGGLTPTAKLDEIKITRGDEELWGSSFLNEALTEGRTLDQLSIRAGDRISIPEPGTGIGGLESAVRTITLLIGLPLTVFGLSRLF